MVSSRFKEASIHMHVHNAVILVWDFAPISTPLPPYTQWAYIPSLVCEAKECVYVCAEGFIVYVVYYIMYMLAV